MPGTETLFASINSGHGWSARAFQHRTTYSCAAALDIQSGNWSEISIAGIQFARAEFLREDSCLSGWNLSQIEKREFSFKSCNKTEVECVMISDEGRNFSPQQSRGFHTAPSRRPPHFRALIKQLVTDMNSYS